MFKSIEHDDDDDVIEHSGDKEEPSEENKDAEGEAEVKVSDVFLNMKLEAPSYAKESDDSDKKEENSASTQEGEEDDDEFAREEPSNAENVNNEEEDKNVNKPASGNLNESPLKRLDTFGEERQDADS